MLRASQTWHLGDHMENKKFTGQSLEEALKNNRVAAHGGATLTGMVKTSENPGHISFTRTGCDTWVDLPVAMIEEAENIGQHACKGHTHPLMRITLIEAKNPQERVLTALLAQSTIAPPTLTPAAMSDMQGAGFFSPLPNSTGAFANTPMERLSTGFSSRAGLGWRIPNGDITIGTNGDCYFVDNAKTRMYCLYCATLTSCWHY